MQERRLGAGRQIESGERLQHDGAVDDSVGEPTQPDMEISGGAVAERQEAQTADPRRQHRPADRQDGPGQHDAEDQAERDMGGRGAGRQLRQDGVSRRGQGGDGQQIEQGPDGEAAGADRKPFTIPVFDPPARPAQQQPHQPFRQQTEQDRQRGFPHALDQQRPLFGVGEAAAQPVPRFRQVRDDCGQVLQAPGEPLRSVGQPLQQGRLGPPRRSLRRLRRFLRRDQRLELRQKTFAFLRVLDGRNELLKRRRIDLPGGIFLRRRRRHREPQRQPDRKEGRAQKRQEAMAKAVEHGPEQAYLFQRFRLDPAGAA